MLSSGALHWHRWQQEIQKCVIDWNIYQSIDNRVFFLKKTLFFPEKIGLIYEKLIAETDLCKQENNFHFYLRLFVVSSKQWPIRQMPLCLSEDSIYRLKNT